MLRRAQSGEAEAIDRLLVATEERLRRVVDSRLGAKLRVSLRRSDVLQNSYLAMLDALPRFEGSSEDEFVAWVAGIIENDIRRQNRWFGAQKRRAPSRTSQRNLLAGILMPSTPTPSAEVAATEEQARLYAALERLEPDQAEIIQMSVFDQLPYAEIATRLARSEGACRMLMLRARTALALELEEMNEGQA